MDWLFVPLGDWIYGCFKYIEGAGMTFNIALIVVGALLGVYWFGQILKHAKHDKGVFRR